MRSPRIFTSCTGHHCQTTGYGLARLRAQGHYGSGSRQSAGDCRYVRAPRRLGGEQKHAAPHGRRGKRHWQRGVVPRITRLAALGRPLLGSAHDLGYGHVLYRKDLAQEKGLTQFKTWDDWLKYAQATNDAPKRYGCTLAGNASLWFNEDVYELSGATAAICGTMRAIPPLPTMLSMARWSSTSNCKKPHAAGLAQPRLCGNAEQLGH